MESMQAYARRPEGRGLLVLIALIVIIDLMARLWPSLPSSTGQSSSLPTSENFQRFTPSSRFTEWAAARQAVKDAAKAAEEAAKQAVQTVSKPETVEKAPFVDRQSGSLKRFQVGNLAYRLWGVFSVDTDQPQGKVSFAVLRPDKGNSKVVATGDTLGDYEVMSVEARRVGFLATDGRKVELELFERSR